TVGWDAARITPELDAVIVGMHARADNPELIRAQELKLPVYSYPEYLYEQTRQKKRIVIGGSHGKTTITSMILHVMAHAGQQPDFMVGAQLEGFECMVRLSQDAPYAVLEGDEYLSSPIDRRPKFHLYHPDIALLSGIAWDHINVFPTFENYLDQFRIFISLIQPGGSLVYAADDPWVNALATEAGVVAQLLPYHVPAYIVENGQAILTTGRGDVPLQVFGKHNLQNLEGARLVCQQAGIDGDTFYQAIQSFKGASRRLELVTGHASGKMFRDFAHSPSKLKATTAALREAYPNRKLVACMELHTFSSLNDHFLDEYANTMEVADLAFVYFNPHTVEHKKLPSIDPERVKRAFASPHVEVFTDSKALTERLRSYGWENVNLLMMSSGNFDGIDFPTLGKELFG
ncbi:MAG: peptidoglycan synthetase, partial [Flavobacteriales bacterium]|nr:peptidoglycan synthetase [Flavobacteriales bacterium]